MAKIVLVGGIPGTKTPRAARSLQEWVTNQDKDWVQHNLEGAVRWTVARKLEDLVVEQYNTTVLEKERVKSIATLLQLPKLILRNLFSDTMPRLDNHLRDIETDKDLVLVPVHFVWYHPIIRDYITVVEASELSKGLKSHIIERIVCLIDDVHDIYSRLRGEHGLYDRTTNKLPSNEAKFGRAFFRHIRILDWRAREISAAESLAYQLGAAFSVLAVKHQKKVAAYCVSGRSQVYFSHPITEARRLEASQIAENKRKADSLKVAIWDLQDKLTEHIALLQPTCVDEYRITEKSGRMMFKPRFYLRDKYKDTLWVGKDCSDDVIYDDLTPEEIQSITQQDTKIARELAKITEVFIEHQVTARDLQLVSQASGIIVFRPRFNGNVADGVKAEISYFLQLSKPGDNRGVLILDSKKDEELFAPRQLLEAMIVASNEKTWNVSLDAHRVVDYMLQLSEEALTLAREAGESQDLDAIKKSVDGILADLGVNKWSLGEVGMTRPLSSQYTYPERQERKQTFLTVLGGKMQPFHQRAEYASAEVIWVDGKTTDKIANEVIEKLSACHRKV